MQRKNWPTARNWWSGRVRAFHLIWLSWPRNESSENRSKDYVSDVNIYWSTSKHLGSWKKQQPWRYICIHIHFIYIIWGYSVHSIDRMLRLYSCYEMKIESHSETVLRCDIAKWNKNQKQGSSTEWHKKNFTKKSWKPMLGSVGREPNKNLKQFHEIVHCYRWSLKGTIRRKIMCGNFRMQAYFIS